MIWKLERDIIIFSIIIDLALDHCYHNTRAEEELPRSGFVRLLLRRLRYDFDSCALHCGRVRAVECFSPVADDAVGGRKIV